MYQSKHAPDLPSRTVLGQPDDVPPPRYEEVRAAKVPDQQHATSCRDPFFAILFILQFIALLVTGWYCFSVSGTGFANSGSNGGSGFSAQGGYTWGSWFLIALDVGISILLSFGILMFTKAQPKFMIWASLIYTFCLSLLGLILAVRNGSVVGVIFGAIAVLFNIMFIYAVRDRIDFTARLLTVAIAFTQAFPSSYLAILFGQALQTAFIWVFWFCAGSIIVTLNDNTNANQYLNYFVYFCLALSYFWGSEVIRNIAGCAVSGIVAAWYFLYPGPNCPRWPVFGALWRACTYSFGSICFGSLIVALLNCVQLAIRLVIESMKQSGDNVIVICFVACAEAMVGFINGMVQYFNQFAYSYVAIYGDDYRTSAKKAYDLFHTRGFDTIINTSLVGSVLLLIEVMISFTCLIVSALISYFGFSNHGDSWGLMAGVGFVIGFTIARTITTVIQTSIITLFVCLADDPATMARTKPELYQLIHEPIRSRFGIDLDGGMQHVAAV